MSGGEANMSIGGRAERRDLNGDSRCHHRLHHRWLHPHTFSCVDL